MGEQEVDDFLGRFRPKFGRDGDQNVRAAREIGGEVEGGGERDRAGVWPGWVARPWSPSGAWGSQGRIEDFRRDQRHGLRPTQPDGDCEVEQPKGEDFGFGRWAVREGGKHQGGALARCRDRIALRRASLQTGCEAVRVR